MLLNIDCFLIVIYPRFPEAFKLFLPGTFKDNEQTLGYINSCGGESNGKQ